MEIGDPDKTPHCGTSDLDLDSLLMSQKYEDSRRTAYVVLVKKSKLPNLLKLRNIEAIHCIGRWCVYINTGRNSLRVPIHNSLSYLINMHYLEYSIE